MQTIVKLKKVNYVDEVYSQMYEMMASGAWAEGQKLPSEPQLAREFNVSRIVIREALQRLRAEKRIITRQGLGSFCANPHNFEPLLGDVGPAVQLEDYLRFLEFRGCIEYASLPLAAQYRTEEDLERMRGAIEEMKHCCEDTLQYTEKDYFFHYSLICATHNPFLIQAYAGNRDMIIRCLLRSNVLSDSKDYSLGFHENLHYFIRTRKDKEAQRLMRTHDDYNRARLVYMFNEQNQSSEK